MFSNIVSKNRVKLLNCINHFGKSRLDFLCFMQHIFAWTSPFSNVPWSKELRWMPMLCTLHPGFFAAVSWGEPSWVDRANKKLNMHAWRHEHILCLCSLCNIFCFAMHACMQDPFNQMEGCPATWHAHNFKKFHVSCKSSLCVELSYLKILSAYWHSSQSFQYILTCI